MIRNLLLYSLVFGPALGVAAAAGAATPEQLIEYGRWKQARVILEAKSRESSQDAQTLYLLSQVKLAFRDLEGALALAEKAVALNGAKAEYHLQLAEVQGQIAENGGLFKKISLAGSIKKELEAAAALDPKNVEGQVGLMQFYLYAPGIAGGDKKRARLLADEILRLDPARGYLAQAEIARQEKETGSLEGLYLKAAEATPRSYEARLNLAGFYASDNQKKYDLAEKYAREALKIEPGRAGGYAVLAIILVYQKNWPELDSALAAAEKNVADNLNPFYQAGRVLLLAGTDLPRAERYFRKYLTQVPEGGSPTLAHAHWRLALVLERQGRKPEAIAELKEALREKPDLQEAKKDLKRLM